MLALVLAQKEKWLMAIGAALLSVLFKESGWITYILVLPVLYMSGQLKRIPPYAFVVALIAIALPLIAREAAGMGLVGRYDIGTNRNWLARYTNAVGGYFLVGMLHGRWVPGLLAVALYLSARWKKSNIVQFVLLIVLSVSVACLAECKAFHTQFVVALVYLFDPSISLFFILASLLFCFSLESLLRHEDLRRTAGWMLLFALLSASSYAAATQILEHALHLSYAFQSTIIGLVWMAVFRDASKLYQRQKHHSSMQTSAK